MIGEKQVQEYVKRVWVDVTAFAILPQQRSGYTGRIHKEGERWKLDAASKFKKKESSLFPNKELKSENKLLQEFFWKMFWWFLKVGFS